MVSVYVGGAPIVYQSTDDRDILTSHLKRIAQCVCSKTSDLG